jgi:lambda repressor-like predicted transcriptional regulator
MRTNLVNRSKSGNGPSTHRAAGLDAVALVAALRALRAPKEVIAILDNLGDRDALDAWAAHAASVDDIALRTGLDRSTVRRQFTRDRLRADAADHIAVALGLHPSQLWPDWFPPAD